MAKRLVDASRFDGLIVPVAAIALVAVACLLATTSYAPERPEPAARPPERRPEPEAPRARLRTVGDFRVPPSRGMVADSSEFAWTDGFPLAGEDLVGLRAQDAVECGEACTRLGGECHGYSFSPSSGDCRLKRVFSTAPGIAGEPSQVVVGVRTRGDSFVERDSYGWVNAALSPEWLPSAEDQDACAAACRWRDASCAGYVFDPDRGVTGRACALVGSARNSNDVSGILRSQP